MNDEDKKLKPGLYIISLPIGNSKDITIRAIEYLQSVDEIYCEDTRVTNKILSIYKIKKSLKNYHDHNGKKVRPEIIKKIKDGKTIALVSDAGTPLISDPGYKLVSELKAKDLYVTAAPGASSPITALTLSGLPTNSFYFLGFLPVKDQSRKNLIEGLKSLKTTIILFESANKINKTLQDLIDILGNREMAICREMTKKFEEIITGKISDIAQKIVSKKLKGEIVIVLYGDNKKDQEINLDEIINSFEGEYRPSELAKIISDQTGFSKSIIYNKIIRLKEDH
ncbi:MAG: 16S rRNA (cytidine(1402)-2'-O)-methyltransferase [Alphaproteobacteria bacterium]|jgi:16S rRNA (cytidine1402-2'-O)-methyltransferase